ncbi:MAG: hypothetical protein A2V86_17255 [Deltaproteobacteria bacterium RBG_16_49_23]|nr:MAG: hypothetical protein A2V86_17255 [Deltaproteobacteria bacterium RBG_16_49_23]
MKKLMLIIVICLLALQINIFVGRPSFAAVNIIEQDPGNSTISARASNVLKILSVLENRIGDQPLIEKAKDKLSTLTDRQTLLIASLSDQVVKERNSTSGDIAFLLIAALIILL